MSASLAQLWHASTDTVLGCNAARGNLAIQGPSTTSRAIACRRILEPANIYTSCTYVFPYPLLLTFLTFLTIPPQAQVASTTSSPIGCS